MDLLDVFSTSRLNGSDGAGTYDLFMLSLAGPTIGAHHPWMFQACYAPVQHDCRVARDTLVLQAEFGSRSILGAVCISVHDAAAAGCVMVDCGFPPTLHNA